MASHLLELLFFGGQIAAVALLAYGAWLCFTAGRPHPRKRAPAPENPASAAAGASERPEGGAWA